jgi:hypothetical protein
VNLKKVDRLRQRTVALESEFYDDDPDKGLILRMPEELLSALARLVSLKRYRNNKRKAFAKLNEEQKRQLWKLYKRRDSDANAIKKKLGPD